MAVSKTLTSWIFQNLRFFVTWFCPKKGDFTLWNRWGTEEELSYPGALRHMRDIGNPGQLQPRCGSLSIPATVEWFNRKKHEKQYNQEVKLRKANRNSWSDFEGILGFLFPLADEKGLTLAIQPLKFWMQQVLKQWFDRTPFLQRHPHILSEGWLS